MPPVRPTATPTNVDQQIYTVTRPDGTEQLARVLARTEGQAYVHYLHQDKRMDGYVPAGSVRLADAALQGAAELDDELAVDAEEAAVFGDAAAGTLTEEEYDILHHKQIGARRNFDNVYFRTWEIRTWYWAPYPMADDERDKLFPTDGGDGELRKGVTSHSRTSDLLAGSLARGGVGVQRGSLWVCDGCFKYMMDAAPWDLHTKKCALKAPPGRKVYQRGAHIIWEIDGAKEKLYCQNLTLFGKLFIDHKTLFFDIDRFNFYALTEGTSTHDYVIGFFSKEKVSYDGNNLACIVIFPPYQKRRFGMLLIEFSYELSRRAGEVGSPERPLSDLGLKSYLSYWIATLVRFFRRMLAVLPPGAEQRMESAGLPDFEDVHARAGAEAAAAPRWKRNKSKGFYGETEAFDAAATAAASAAPRSFDEDAARFRTFVTTANADGSATTRVLVRCTLADLARATGLRPEDAAFALNEAGLVRHRLRAGAPGWDGALVITREAIEAVARERGVKEMALVLAHVLL